MKIDFLNYLLSNEIDSNTSLNVINLDERIVSRIMLIKDEKKLKIITKHIFNIILSNGIDNSIIIVNHLINMNSTYFETMCLIASNNDFCSNHTLSDQLLLFTQLQFCDYNKRNLIIKFLCNINVLLNRDIMSQLRLLECLNNTDDPVLLNKVLDIITDENLCNNYDVESQLEFVYNLFLSNKENVLILKK